jgi:hypothetical protein
MNTLILLVESDSSWSPLIWAMHNAAESTDDGRVVIGGRLGWLAIHADQSILDDFDDDEKADALGALVEPAIFVVEWRGDPLIERFVKDVPSDCRVFVDNDHGVFAPVAVLQGLPAGAWARAVTSM